MGSDQSRSRLILELKCQDRFDNRHLAQCIYYLKVSGLQVALLNNFQRLKLE
ncbi:MAG: GxxExxY protein [Bryobacteraceae bacterium]